MTQYNAQTDIPEDRRLAAEVDAKRLNAYMEELGNWQSQLDMIYHDIDAWREKVSAIKAAHPKP